MHVCVCVCVCVWFYTRLDILLLSLKHNYCSLTYIFYYVTLEMSKYSDVRLNHGEF